MSFAYWIRTGPIPHVTHTCKSRNSFSLLSFTTTGTLNQTDIHIPHSDRMLLTYWVITKPILPEAHTRKSRNSFFLTIVDCHLPIRSERNPHSLPWPDVICICGPERNRYFLRHTPANPRIRFSYSRWLPFTY